MLPQAIDSLAESRGVRSLTRSSPTSISSPFFISSGYYGTSLQCHSHPLPLPHPHPHPPQKRLLASPPQKSKSRQFRLKSPEEASGSIIWAYTVYDNYHNL